nr:uncharacterized protein LOC129424288 [Misgurnus anguillicaudatus]
MWNDTAGERPKAVVVKKLWHEDTKTELHLSVYTGVLAILKEYVMVFQSRDTLVHKLHDKQLQVFTNFLACFVKPEHLPPIPRTLAGLKLKGDKLLPARDMYVGRVADRFRREHPQHHLLKPFLDQVLQGYIACGEYLQSKLPLESMTLQCLPAVDPIARGHSKTGCLLRCVVVDSLLENCDILCLQETFLPMQDLDKLNSIHDHFHGAGESTVDLGMDIIKGRISGGVAILWNKKLDPLVKVIRLDVNWCIAIQITYQDKNFIILNVYTPYESHHNEDEYLNRLAFISSFIESSTVSSVYVIGDMNADISDKKSIFSSHIAQFCHDNNLILSTEVCLPVDSYTYVSEAWNTTSWLDHCISTADAHASLSGMSILYGIVTTDHIPVSIVINAEFLVAMSNNDNNVNIAKIDWSALTEEDLSVYYVNTDRCLGNIKLPRDAIMCSDVNCKDPSHQRDICSMYNDIVNALHGCSKPFFKLKGIPNKTRPGWSKYVSEYQDEAREAFKLWDIAGRPRQGPELEYKKSTNARYNILLFYLDPESVIKID